MQFVYDKTLNYFLSTQTNGLTRKTKKRIMAMYRNNWIVNITINRLIDVYMSVYTITASTPWGGSSKKLPAGMSDRVIKLSFLMNACCVFCDGLEWNKQYFPGKYAMYGFPSGKGFNINGNPLSATVMSLYNGMISEEVPLYMPEADDAPLLEYAYGRKQEEEPRGFIVWENKSRFPLIYTIIYFALCISDSYRTLDTTRRWLKKPVIFTADKELVNSINEVIEAMDYNEEYTIENSSLGSVGQATNMFNTNENGQNLKDVTSLIEWYENKVREEYGIDSNPQMDKKGENLQTAEITVNNEYQTLRSNSRIDTMNESFDEAAEWFGVRFHAEPNVGKQVYMNPGQDQRGDNKDGGQLQNVQ